MKYFFCCIFFYVSSLVGQEVKSVEFYMHAGRVKAIEELTPEILERVYYCTSEIRFKESQEIKDHEYYFLVGKLKYFMDILHEMDREKSLYDSI